jgi:hypothetical protein
VCGVIDFRHETSRRHYGHGIGMSYKSAGTFTLTSGSGYPGEWSITRRKMPDVSGVERVKEAWHVCWDQTSMRKEIADNRIAQVVRVRCLK